MSSPSELKPVLERALSLAPTKECELIVREAIENLTRFGSNAITQNVSRRSRALTIHLKDGPREAVTEVNSFDDRSLRAGFEKAKRVLDLSKPNEKILPFLSEKQTYRATNAWREGVAEHSPQERARMVQKAIERCKKEGLEASGVCEANASVCGYANSNGIMTFFPQTVATFSVTATSKEGDSEGWAEEEREDPREIGVERVIETAVEGGKWGRKPRAQAPGHYTVVLEPAAVAELLLFYSWLGCGAQRYLEGRSYCSGRLGQKFFSEKLTMRDDPFDSRAPGMPFDFEGVATKPVTLVEKGVAKELVWDRRTAAQAKHETTGHGLPQPNSQGPMARHLVMDGDEKTTQEDLVRGMKDGLLVTKLHYCNVVNPMDLSITGMTRSGVGKVENGEVVHPVKNFRFTVSLLDVFSKIEALARPERATGALFGGRFVVPAMRVAGFNMTSATEF
ncbi:MAG TPA: metallopeptidase TldD-related protein [Planctomycetota bacterium]|nr:metallopeptidase TldD-related protein [Planctomycetota bacterium]